MPVGSGACNAKLHKAEGKAKDGADGEACTRQKEDEPGCQAKWGAAFEFEQCGFFFCKCQIEPEEFDGQYGLRLWRYLYYGCYKRAG